MINTELIRKDFPVLTNNPKLAYLDNSATSLKPTCVINKITEYYEQYGVNVHRGVYGLSYKASEEYESTREVVARFINASTEEVVFTRGATDSLNMIATMLKSKIASGDEIVTTELEHHSSVMPWQVIAKENNAILKYVPLNQNGRITIENFEKTLTSKTKIVAITYMSNVMGYITPIKEIIKLAHQVGAIVVVDAAQAAPHMKIDVKDIDADFLAFSAHKMLGPTGLGILYGKYQYLQAANPIALGGDMNDGVELYDATYKDAPHRFEAGTPAIAEVIAFKEAINYLNNIGMENIAKHEHELSKYVIDKVKQIPNIKLYNETVETGIISFNIENVHPHDAASIFDECNVALRAGHHCAQLITSWLGCNGTLRASFYFYNDYKDADQFIDALQKAVTFFKEWE